MTRAIKYVFLILHNLTTWFYTQEDFSALNVFFLNNSIEISAPFQLQKQK